LNTIAIFHPVTFELDALLRIEAEIVCDQEGHRLQARRREVHLDDIGGESRSARPDAACRDRKRDACDQRSAHHLLVSARSVSGNFTLVKRLQRVNERDCGGGVARCIAADVYVRQ
jgi:hypothetical protein